MSLIERIKNIVTGKNKRKQQPVQVVEHQHHWVRTPPPPKTFSQKIESLRKKTDKFTKKEFQPASKETDVVATTKQSVPQKMFGPATGQAIERTGGQLVGGARRMIQASQGSGITEAVRSAQQRVEPAARRIISNIHQQATHYKSVTQSPKELKETAKERQRTIVGGFVSFMGRGVDPYYAPIKGAKQTMGRRISKREAKRLKTLFGENWQSKLKKNSKGYYVEPTQADIVQAMKERKLASRGVDFGHGFEQIRTGMEVPLTSEMGRVPGERLSEDPFNIDARFGNANIMMGTSRMRRDPYDINANFGGGFKL